MADPGSEGHLCHQEGELETPTHEISAQRPFSVTHVAWQPYFFLNNGSLYLQTFIPRMLED
jgi:hypothetical protein